MATLLSLLTSLITLALIGGLYSAVFKGGSQSPARGSTSASDGDADKPGSGLWDSRKPLGRCETTQERDRYHRCRGNEANWAE